MDRRRFVAASAAAALGAGLARRAGAGGLDEAERRLQARIARLYDPMPPRDVDCVRERLEKAEGLDKLLTEGWGGYHTAQYDEAAADAVFPAATKRFGEVVSAVDAAFARCGVKATEERAETELVVREFHDYRQQNGLQETPFAEVWAKFVPAVKQQYGLDLASAEPSMVLKAGEAWFGLGAVHFAMGRFDRSLPCFERSTMSGYDFNDRYAYLPPWMNTRPAGYYDRNQKLLGVLAQLEHLEVNDGGQVPILNVYSQPGSPYGAYYQAIRAKLVEVYQQLKQRYWRDTPAYLLRGMNIVVLQDPDMLRIALRTTDRLSRESNVGNYNSTVVYQEASVDPAPLWADDGNPLPGDVATYVLHCLYGHALQARLQAGHWRGMVFVEGHPEESKYHVTVPGFTPPLDGRLMFKGDLRSVALFGYMEPSYARFTAKSFQDPGWSAAQHDIRYMQAALFSLYTNMRGNPARGKDGIQCRDEALKSNNEQLGVKAVDTYGADWPELWAECFTPAGPRTDLPAWAWEFPREMQGADVSGPLVPLPLWALNLYAMAKVYFGWR